MTTRSSQERADPAAQTLARRRTIGIAITVIVGLAMSVQARINGELGDRIDDGVIAAFISFVGGLVLLGVIALSAPSVREGLGRVRQEVRTRRLPPVLLLGGTCGAFLVSCQGLTIGTIGVAVFTVAVVAGQGISSLLVDRAGIGPGGAQPITVTRLIGAAVALAAVALSVSDRLDDASGLGLAILPALAGIGIAWQQAVNGRVGAAARGPEGAPIAGALPASFMNFVTGTAALTVAVGVDLAIRGGPEPFPSEPWLYLGGVFGLVFIALAAAIVPYTGVLLLGLGTVAGQVIGALVLDAVLPAGDDHLTTTTVLGTVLTLVAVGVAALGSRQAGTARR